MMPLITVASAIGIFMNLGSLSSSKSKIFSRGVKLQKIEIATQSKPTIQVGMKVNTRVIKMGNRIENWMRVSRLFLKTK